MGLGVSLGIAAVSIFICTRHCVLSLLVLGTLLASMSVVTAAMSMFFTDGIDLVGTVGLCILAGTSLDYRCECVSDA